jgi:GTP-binding protein
MFADEFGLFPFSNRNAAARGRLRGRGSDASENEGALHFISAVTQSGLDGLLDNVLAALESVETADTLPPILPEMDLPRSEYEELPVLRPKPRRETVLVRKRGDVFDVRARRAVRIAALLNEDDWNARMQFLGYLQRAGVVRALEEAGVGPGDTVRFGEVEWEWE